MTTRRSTISQWRPSGSQANKELLRGTPITAEKAILVDEFCRTKSFGIYAAWRSSCAVFDRRFGKHRVLDHFESARISGSQLAAANMAGDQQRFDAVNFFFNRVVQMPRQRVGKACG